MFVGLIASVFVLIPQVLWIYFPDLNQGRSWQVQSAVVLVFGSVFSFLQYRFLAQRSHPYDGLADLLTETHTPAARPNPNNLGESQSLRLLIQGISSLFLAFFGLFVGLEGAATEFVQSSLIRYRQSAVKWFEEERRTEVASILAGAISASFGAPFSGMLLPVELGIGGRTLKIAGSAIFAFLLQRGVIQFLFGGAPFGIEKAAVFDLSKIALRDWIGLILIGPLCGLIGVILIQFIKYTRGGLTATFGTNYWKRCIFGCAVLAFLIAIYRFPLVQLPQVQMDLIRFYGEERPLGELALLLLTQILGLSIVLSCIGSMGIFWPIYVIGGLVGQVVNATYFGGHADFSIGISIIAASALLGSVVGVPLSGALLAYEISWNTNIFLVALAAGFLAVQMRKILGFQNWVDHTLKVRGLSLVGGRSAAILEAISVRSVMVTDFDEVREQDPLASLPAKLISARYPFLPVISPQGLYRGMVTIDMLQDQVFRVPASAKTSNAFVESVLETKDLLYRTGRNGMTTPTILADQNLLHAMDLFKEFPCLPVLDHAGKVLGLLFVHHVRLAYDHEVLVAGLKSSSGA